MTHEELVKDTREAIDKVFGDMSVRKDTTRESLEEIVEHAQASIAALDDCASPDDDEAAQG